MLDYAGKANTDAVVASTLAGDAFTFATALGSEWYLPAGGEMEDIRLNVANINIAMSNIGGTPLNFSNTYYWFSAQSSKDKAWYWFYPYNQWLTTQKTDNKSCRAVCAF